MVRGGCCCCCCYDNITIRIDRNLTNFFQRFLMHAPFQNCRKFIIMTIRLRHHTHQRVSLCFCLSVLWHHSAQCFHATYANDSLFSFCYRCCCHCCIFHFNFDGFQFRFFFLFLFYFSSFISVQFSVQSHQIGSVSVQCSVCVCGAKNPTTRCLSECDATALSR